MSWEAREVNGKWCSVNTETSKPVACFGSSESAAEGHVKALFANAKENLEDGGNAGITLLRVAYTNEPHLRLRKHQMTVVEVDGEKVIRHPIMVAGKYRHPRAKNGVLDLNGLAITDPKHKFNRVIANHHGNVTDAGVYTRPGHGSREAWAWLSPEHGGWMSIEEDKGDTVLVAYGKATSEDRLQRIERGEFRYNSADLHLRYKSNQILEEGDQDVVSWGELQILEDSMSDVTLTSEEHEALLAYQKEADKLKLESEKLADQLETQKSALEGEVHSLKVRLEEFEVGDDDDNDLPDGFKAMLAERDDRMARMEERLQEAEREKVLGRLRQAIALASTPDSDGHILDSFTLEAVKDYATNKGFQLDDVELKLEEGASPQDTFYNSVYFLSYLLENTPRSIGGEAGTSPDNRRLDDAVSFSDEEMDAVIDDLNPHGVPITQGGD